MKQQTKEAHYIRIANKEGGKGQGEHNRKDKRLIPMRELLDAGHTGGGLPAPVLRFCNLVVAVSLISG